jgi:hypothetical protein
MKEALITSASKAVDNKSVYDRMIHESNAALETQRYITDELKKMLEYTHDVSTAQVGELPVLIEEPPKSYDQGSSSYFLLHRLRKFCIASVETDDEDCPIQETVPSGTVTIGESTIRLAPFEVCQLFRVIVGPQLLMDTIGDHVMKYIIKKNVQLVNGREPEGNQELLQHGRALLLSVLLPYPDEPYILSDSAYITKTKATDVDVSKVSSAVYTYYNSMSTRMKHKEYLECRKKNILADVAAVALGRAIRHTTKYRHILTSSEYHVDISVVEQDPDMLYDVIRVCRSFGTETMLTRVKRYPARGTYLCLNFEEHIDLDFQETARVTKAREKVNAVYLTLVNYCLVSSGMRTAVEQAMSQNRLDVSQDTFYHKYMPCGISHGVENLTNASIKYLYLNYAAQLNVIPLPPSPPPIIPTFPTREYPRALTEAMEKKQLSKKPLVTKAATVARQFTPEMYTQFINRYNNATKEEMTALIAYVTRMGLPKDAEGEVNLSYPCISDEVGFGVYTIFFPPIMERESDDDFDFEDV